MTANERREEIVKRTLQKIFSGADYDYSTGEDIVSAVKMAVAEAYTEGYADGISDAIRK